MKWKNPKSMKVITLTRDCFYGDKVTPKWVMLQEKYIKRFSELAHEFVEGCIYNQIESASLMGFFFAWLMPTFIEAQLDVSYGCVEQEKLV